MITVTPERLYGTLPRGIGATTGSEGPSHRRYGSDTTTAIILGDRSRPSAFKAYSKDQLATEASVQAPAVENVTYQHSHHQSFSGTIAKPGGAPAGPPGAQAEFRTHSAADVHHLELNWNPFKMPSQGAATTGAEADMNDVEFAASFDRLPRRNSASSESISFACFFEIISIPFGIAIICKREFIFTTV